MSPLLSCRNAGVAYDKVQVLFGVDLDVEQGEIVALLGTNGAGKSTLLKAVSGVAPTNSGTIVFDGVDITKATPQETTARGIVQVPGGKAVFPTLSVAEHFRAGCWLYAQQDPAFNAIFFKHLLLLAAERDDPRYRRALQAYADQAWDTARDPTTNLFHFRPDRPVTLLDQAAAVQLYALLAWDARQYRKLA